MITISLCMIVRDEEETIERCLESVTGVADEIIVVDTGSADCTREIVSLKDASLHEFKWVDDFSAARNFSFSLARMDYILWLDADDVLDETDRVRLVDLKRTLDPSVDVVMMRYNAGFDRNGQVTLSYYRERLLKRAGDFRWVEPVHECIEPRGNIFFSDICVTHRRLRPAPPGRNLSIYEKLIAGGHPLSSRSLFYYGSELCDAIRYEEAAAVFRQFLERPDGWVEDKIRACFRLGECLRMLGRHEEALPALLKSLEYDTPRAEICCGIGGCFKSRGDYARAAFWFEQAAGLKPPANNWGFVHHDYYGFIPALELCVCHYWLGNMQEAARWNARAAALKPNDPSVLHNNRLFGGAGQS